MRHRDAIELLPEHGTGWLDPDAEEALAAHVARCPACRDWLATRDLLAEELSRGSYPSRLHPDSELLAICALRPEEVYEYGRSALRAHLADCAECRQELELVRAAVDGARPHRVGMPTPTAGRVQTPYRRLALAAALTVALLGAGAVLQRYVIEHADPGREQVEESPSAPRRVSRDAGPAEVISGRELEGKQSIDGDSTLVVSKLTVKPGADIEIRAKRSVALGDGFRVEKGARLAVSTVLADHQEKRVN